MITTTVTHEFDPRLRTRLFEQAIKQGMAKALIFWHTERAARHFKAGAAAMYGYQKRSEKYEKRKERVKHHKQPLVWSGTLRDSIVKGQPVPKFKEDKSGVLKGYIVFKVPKYAYQRRGTAPDKMAEVFATTELEASEMAKIMMEEADRIIKATKRPYRRKIGAA